MSTLKELRKQAEHSNRAIRIAAENCLKIYETMKKIRTDGWVSSNEFGMLTTCAKSGDEWYYKPSAIGIIFLRGIEK